MAQSPASPPARYHVAHPYLALMCLYLGGFTGMYSETALNIALPQLSVTFGVDLALTQWLVISYMLVIGLVLPFSSFLTKWFSARSLVLFALSTFLVGSLISGFAPNFAIALAGRAVQGIGTGMILPLMFAMTFELIPPHRIGHAMGVSALVIMFAPVIGPTLSGILIGALSWRAVFFSFAIVLAVALVFAVAFVVNPYDRTRPAPDVPSILLSCAGFGGIVLGSGIASLYGWISAPTLAALVVGIVCLGLYIKRQLSQITPVIDMRIFHYSGFRVGALCVMLNFGITLTAMYVLPQFYQTGMLLTVSVAGLMMLPGGCVNALVSVIAGGIFDRIGARIPALVGFGLSITGLIMLLQATPETPGIYMIVCHIVTMIGVPLAMSPCQTHALSSLPPELSTDGSTMMNTMQQVVGAVCTAVATSLLAAGQAASAATGADAAQAFTTGSHWGFIFALVLAVAAFVFAFTLKKPAVAKNNDSEGAPAPQTVADHLA